MDARFARSAASLLVALAAAVAMPAAAVAAPEQARPELVGLSVDEAVAVLEQADLVPLLDPEQLPDGVDEARVVVVEQDALSDPDGVAVYGWRLVLGAAVPDVVGRSLADAADELAAVGLSAVSRAARDADRQVVVGQSPEPGALRVFESRVELDVEPGVIVPDVVGMTRDEAAAAVEDVGLTLTASGGGDRPGPVESQVPEAGSLVAAGTPVAVVLTVLPPRQVVVPDLAGLSVDQARQRLLDVGLVLEATVQGEPAEARSVSQSPAAGSLAAPASTVAVQFESALVPVVPVADEREIPWSLVPVVVGALVLVAGLLWRALRPSRERAWVRQHVAVRGHPDLAAPVAVERPDHDVCSAVRVEVRPDPGTRELEEVPS
jgi:beta-lactam-binding protein with PASTA domain